MVGELEDRVVAGFHPDLLVVTADAWVAGQATHPLTGHRCGPGDLGRVAAAHDGEARGWVYSAMVTIAADRDGRSTVARSPYRVTDGAVTWLDDEDLPVTEEAHQLRAKQLFGLLVDHRAPDFPGTLAEVEAQRARADLAKSTWANR